MLYSKTVNGVFLSYVSDSEEISELNLKRTISETLPEGILGMKNLENLEI